jgi:magnesium-transporting ATPase (P-type)
VRDGSPAAPIAPVPRARSMSQTGAALDDDAARTLDEFWSHDPQALMAEQRLAKAGPNAINEQPAADIGRLALRQFASPLVLILVSAGAITALLREWVEAVIILVVVLGSSALGYQAST